MTHTDIQTIFQQELEKFQAHLNNAVKETCGRIEAEYLPFVVPDVEMNAYIMAGELVRKIIAGDKEAMARVGIEQSGSIADQVRSAIYRQHKDELQNAIIKDLERKAEHLQSMLDRSY